MYICVKKLNFIIDTQFQFFPIPVHPKKVCLPMGTLSALGRLLPRQKTADRFALEQVIPRTTKNNENKIKGKNGFDKWCICLVFMLNFHCFICYSDRQMNVPVVAVLV